MADQWRCYEGSEHPTRKGVGYREVSSNAHDRFPTELPGTRTLAFDAYWMARPSRLKSTVRRRLAQAAAEQVEFRLYRSELADASRTYAHVYRASWKDAEPHPSFIRTMIEKVGQYGFVRIGIMSFRGNPVAAQIWLVYRGKATIFKLAHREDVNELSPGTLLTHWMMSTLIRDEGLTEIDFGRGSDAYKRAGLAESRIRIGVVADDLGATCNRRRGPADAAVCSRSQSRVLRFIVLRAPPVSRRKPSSPMPVRKPR